MDSGNFHASHIYKESNQVTNKIDLFLDSSHFRASRIYQVTNKIDLFLDSSNFRVSHSYKESNQVTNKIADMDVSLNSATWLVPSSRCLFILINRDGMMLCY